MPLLFKLFKNGQIEELRVALASGEDVNSRNAAKETLLMYVVQPSLSKARVSILRVLLEQPSIEVNLVDDKGQTVLHLATLFGRCEAVRLLLADPRVDVNSRDA